MKVAVNCAFLQPRGGGIKEYMVNLVRNLSRIEPDNDYVVYVLRDFRDYADRCLSGADVRIKEIPFGTGSNLKKIVRSLAERRFWLREEREERWDLFHSPFFHAPALRATKILLTVHDLRFVRYPETYSRLRVIFLRHAVRRSILHASHIIAISEFTKRDIMNAYGVEGNRITTVHEAINPDDFSSRHEAGEGPEQLSDTRFILSVGHLEPRKNYAGLIGAFRKMKDGNPSLKDVRLVIVGRKECRYGETLRLIEGNPDVDYLDFVSHETLIWLYRHARLFAFPSFYEGFGFPPLEAAALGLPSAVSDVASIPEICGDGVIYFNPNDIDDMARALERGLVDGSERRRLIENLPWMAGAYSWERNASETLGVYHSLAAPR